MPFVEPQFVNGRNRVDSQIQLVANWLDGWKFKDSKWKFEEEIKLPHVNPAYFRCRVHLFAGFSDQFRTEAIRERVGEIDCAHVLEGVTFVFLEELLLVKVPLNLKWSKTKNESRNPCLFRETGQQGLSLKPIGDLSFQILITYRGLNQLLRSEKMFVEDQTSFSWIGSPRHRESIL